MSNDLVSIIMLSHNNGTHVKETIDSVKAQTYQNWELLFVDDNSKDDTVHKMLELNGNDKRINVSRSVYEKGRVLCMYDASKVGEMYTRDKGMNNDYALWLNVCEKADCHTTRKPCNSTH